MKTQVRMQVTGTIHFPCCWVTLADGWTETGFHDGTSVTAVPEDSADYRALAARLGYKDDLKALSREHEILHSFLAWKENGGASPTLWAVAHQQEEGNSAPLWEQEWEEERVLAFQHYLNGGPGDAPPLCGWAKYHGLNLDGLRQEALALLRGPEMAALTKSTV